mmetsp:Transcript_8559/g.13557  ORF Transcript_8559/g.13557 Transcript_8559/m.13557 type:complete len:99 (-) Transcript_8559:59-355(-)
MLYKRKQEKKRHLFQVHSRESMSGSLFSTGHKLNSFEPQCSWQFDGSMTNASTFPILSEQPKSEIETPNDCIQKLLASWDPRIDEYFNQYVNQASTFW